MPFLAHDFMNFVKPHCSKNKKCIVLDLDNTLWGGIVGEDGFNGIRLDTKPPGNAYRDFQRQLLAMHRRGIILAINSRNNQDDALKVIRDHPSMILREDHFAALKINWKDKITNMKAIAEELNIGTDSFVFFDDDEAQRELIKTAMPEVLVVDLPRDPALYARTFKEINDFNTFQVTQEDLKRGELYAGQRKAASLKSQFSTMEDFLKNLHMEVEIKKINSFTLPRVAQLIKKTNQFNLTARRYSEDEVEAMSKNSAYEIYTVNVKDKFVDHGLVGVFILHERQKQKWFIDTFLLSCRVIGRDVEKVIAKYIADLAGKRSIPEIVGEYVPTEKNVACKGLYHNLGFSQRKENIYVLKDFKKVKGADYIKTIL